jgi:hypothetical protein
MKTRISNEKVWWIAIENKKGQIRLSDKGELIREGADLILISICEKAI